MDDRTLALLGDRAAQERITKHGELLPCPFCGNKNIRTSNWGMWRCWCPECFGKSEDMLWERDAIKHWNTRAPILTTENAVRLCNVLDGLERTNDTIS